MGRISKFAPKTCSILQRSEFEYEVVDSDGESVGVYGDEDKAKAVCSRREAMHRDKFMREWRRPE
jgi:hypothetical protein